MKKSVDETVMHKSDDGDSGGSDDNLLITFESNESHDHEEHVDERWLVSYADMMTLLFGLFVMLYSMANKFEAVQRSAAKQFNTENAMDVTSDPRVQLPSPTPINENPRLEIEKLTKENEELVAKVASLTALREKTESESQDSLQALQKELEMKTTQKKDEAGSQLLELQRRLADREKESRAKIDELNNKLEALKAKAQEQKTSASKSEDLAQMNREAVTKNAALEKRLEETQKELEQLNKELLDLKNDAPKAKPFATIAITWPTKDHDIDLIVTDPNGKKFDFKHRSFNGQPGEFVLDTRRGPGAEMWQTNNLVPGIYEVKYVFYNTYGNEEPVSISGTLHTLHGAFQLPKVQLDFKKQKEHIFRLKISPKGHVDRL